MLRQLLLQHRFNRYIPNIVVQVLARSKFTIAGIDENDLTEKFVRGSGPGGQSVNTAKNSVQLVHVPTGIRVDCHEQR